MELCLSMNDPFFESFTGRDCLDIDECSERAPSVCQNGRCSNVVVGFQVRYKPTLAKGQSYKDFHTLGQNYKCVLNQENNALSKILVVLILGH